MSVVKLYEGLIVNTPEKDPEKEFRYNDPEKYEAELLAEIEKLQATVNGFCDGSYPSQMIVCDEKTPDAIKVLVEEHNTNIGYVGALKELREKQEILNCLRGESCA